MNAIVKCEKDEKLHSDVSHIVNSLLLILQTKPLAILLCGGYGRDEGAWFFNDGILSTYNDYDFAVITNDVPDRNKINTFRKQMAHDVGISWVDIDFYTDDKISDLKSTIKNVDLLYGSKVVYGHYDFSKAKELVRASDIGDKDIIILYQTRIWTFLGSWKGIFRDLNVEETRFFKNQMAKAVLAAVDMLLIKEKKYTSSYRERVSIISKLYSSDEKLCNLSKWALLEKMNPSSEVMNKNDMEELYFDVKDLFIKSFKIALPSNSDLFLNPDKTIYFYKKNKLHYYLRFIYELVIRHKFLYKKVVAVFLAQNYTFHALGKIGSNEKYLDKAAHILKKYGYIDNINKDIHVIREMAAFARNNI